MAKMNRGKNKNMSSSKKSYGRGDSYQGVGIGKSVGSVKTPKAESAGQPAKMEYGKQISMKPMKSNNHY